MQWFDTNKAGLAKILTRRGMAFVVFELVQNPWDTAAKRVEVRLEPVPARPFVQITVTDDDPDGFKDLSHAFTLFAESEKKGDPTRRGRFNLGEKLVLAMCEEAKITSTKGAVVFDASGRHLSKQKTKNGSIFSGLVRMTREQLDEVRTSVLKLIPPEGIETIVDGIQLPDRPSLCTFEATLLTEVSDAEGYLKRSPRKTRVTVHEVLPGEEPSLYEMGIPVVPLGGGERWHVNVHQKVPLSVERDNVTPAYLQALRVFLVNAMQDHVQKDDANATWVTATLDDERIAPEAVTRVLEERYGAKRAVFDPSDPEANNRWVAEGGTLIPGGAFSKDAWKNIRSAGAALPAGKLLPTPKPYSSDPDAPSRKLVPEADWTPGMRRMAAYARALAPHLIEREIAVCFDKGKFGQSWVACYGDGELTFNVASLGYVFFDEGPSERVNALLIHEFAHEAEANHLSKDFYKQLQQLGAKMVGLALAKPSLFTNHGWKKG